MSILKRSLCPISVLCQKFYPRDIIHIPAVKFFACLGVGAYLNLNKNPRFWIDTLYVVCSIKNGLTQLSGDCPEGYLEYGDAATWTALQRCNLKEKGSIQDFLNNHSRGSLSAVLGKGQGAPPTGGMPILAQLPPLGSTGRSSDRMHQRTKSTPRKSFAWRFSGMLQG